MSSVGALPAPVLSASDAFAAGSQQLVPSALTQATDIACQLAVVTAAGIQPVSAGGEPIVNRLLWIIMYQSLGPGSHGHSESSGPRDLYLFIDANSGSYLFGLSANQPAHG